MIKAVLGNLWLDSAAYENVGYVVDNFGNRFMGTESERKTKDYLLTLFKQYGLENVHAEPYKYIGWKRGTTKVEMTSPVTRELWNLALPHSASTSAGGLEAEVVDLGKGTREDFEKNRNVIPGKIVMVTTGYPAQNYFSLTRTVKYGWAIDFGAIAFILRSETSGQLIETGSVATGYRNTGEIPAVSVSFETGAFIERQLQKGPVRVKMKVDNEITPNATGWNVVGDIVGGAYPQSLVVMGAHYDGHDIGQEAASDNLLGVMVMLDVARELAKFKKKLRRTIQFVAFGNEECWTVGSVNYVAQHEKELRNIDLMVNGDGLGRTLGMGVSVGCPSNLVESLARLLQDWKIDLPLDRAARWASTSDCHPFIMEGVPTISLSERRPSGWGSRGVDVKDHTIADTFDKLDRSLIKQHALLLAQLLIALTDVEEPLASHLPKNEVLEELQRRGYVEILKAQRRWHPNSVLGV
jgi:hypothetical protein